MRKGRGCGLTLALRSSQAAAALGVSEGLLRVWVAEGIVHKPFRVRKNVVLFDANALATDWDRIKEQAEQGYELSNSNKLAQVNEWDELIKE